MRDQGDSEFRDGFPFLGGRLWIDFLNSAPAALGDLIATPGGWARWIAAAGVGADAAEPGSGKQVTEAQALRAAFADIFEAISRDRRPGAAAIALVNRHLADSPIVRRLDIHDGHLCLHEVKAGGASPFGAIVADFADFLAGYERPRLRHCHNPECSLVFYDTARNGTRRWCSMALCGNRHKVKAHRARKTLVISET